MSNIFSTYYHRTASKWWERMMRNYSGSMFGSTTKGTLTIPNWLSGQPIAFFFISLFLCWGAYGYVPDFEIVLISCISVVLFFYGAFSFAQSTARVGDKRFVRDVFNAGLIVRLIWILYLYFIYNPNHWGNTYGDTSDVDWYIPFGKDLALWLSGSSQYSLIDIMNINSSAIDDAGYPMWLGVIYLITGVDNDILVPFLCKCIMGAYCAVCIYRVAKRHFGIGTARMAAIFVAFNPNMIYWCGTMMKEAEMVFLVCLAVDNFDRVLSSGHRYTFRALLPGMLAAIALFFFRTALAMVIFTAVFAHVVMASNRVMSLGKKIIASMLVAFVLMLSIGNRVMEQSRSMFEEVQAGGQEKNMEWRANREGGNAFAKYAGAAVFAPLIFTIPFPTFNVAHEGQVALMQLSGGAYIKNIFSFFVIFVLIMLLISGEWRRHVFIFAYTLGYHMVLVLSPFAQSGRFHMPVWPMLMLFAAYGIQIAKTKKRLKKIFSMVLVAEVLVCLAWNWFKLKGRGMI